VIDGPNLPPNFFFDEPPDGVDNRAGHDRVTIQNGSIREFRQGVDIGGFREGIGETPSTGNVVRNVQISSDRGVEASVASRLTLEGNTIQSRVWAVLAADTHDSVVLDNRATSIPPILGGASISILNGQFDLAGRNVIRGNRVSGGDIEIAGSGSLVTRNAVFGGLDAGVALMDPGNIASRNFVTGQSLGLFVRPIKGGLFVYAAGLSPQSLVRITIEGNGTPDELRRAFTIIDTQSREALAAALASG